jgi:hypothetical protein
MTCATAKRGQCVWPGEVVLNPQRGKVAKTKGVHGAQKWDIAGGPSNQNNKAHEVAPAMKMVSVEVPRVASLKGWSKAAVDASDQRNCKVPEAPVEPQRMFKLLVRMSFLTAP